MGATIMQNLKLFTTLDPSQFESATAQFTGKQAQDSYKLFNDWIANCVYKYFEHRDATHLNRVLQAAKSRGVYRDYLSFAKGVSAHEFKQGKFIGKMDSTKMFNQSQVNDDDVLTFEQSLYDLLLKLSAKAVDKENAKSEPITKDKAEKRMRSLFMSIGKAGMTLEDVDKIYFDIRASFEGAEPVVVEAIKEAS